MPPGFDFIADIKNGLFLLSFLEHAESDKEGFNATALLNGILEPALDGSQGTTGSYDARLFKCKSESYGKRKMSAYIEK